MHAQLCRRGIEHTLLVRSLQLLQHASQKQQQHHSAGFWHQLQAAVVPQGSRLMRRCADWVEWCFLAASAQHKCHAQPWGVRDPS